MKAGPLADRPVIASICFSSTITVRPTESNMNLARLRWSRVAFFPGAIPVIPFFNRQGVLGIARMTGTGELRCFSMKVVLTEAATDTRICEGFNVLLISDRTRGTVCGLTASSTRSARSTASELERVHGYAESFVELIEARLMTGGYSQLANIHHARFQQALNQNFTQLARTQHRKSLISQHKFSPDFGSPLGRY